MQKNTFIRAIEYWRPSADGTLLEFGGGLFGGATCLQAATEQLCFGRGEGLPGQAWEQGRPIVLKDLEHSYFRRGAAARAEGLSCGIALPVFAGAQLRAVAVLFCGDDAAHAGAIELWANRPGDSADLTLVDGYYGTTGDTFEFISRATAFRRGTGLPGLAWQAQRPVFLPDLGKGSGFLRADSAVKVGINRGFAMPASSTDGADYVVAFLSALDTPIARGVAVWEAAAAGPQCRFAFSEAEGVRDAAAPTLLADACVAEALRTGQPGVAGNAIALPVAPQGHLTSVLHLVF
ncbi:GAF domain-containing protein [Pseudorhodoferax sp.]|uniref:GAF domain-containing protein n=1 Tax=Pseudorhodoferax sp. TaxID=1993553 RepID=UPI0039E35004